jgi:hypothetical protein
MSAALAAVQPIAGGDHFAPALPVAVAVMIYRLTTSTRPTSAVCGPE